MCCSGVGDEMHYLFKCDNIIIKEMRLKCFNNISGLNQDFLNYTDEEKLQTLMSTNESNILNNFGFFLFKLETIFDDIKPSGFGR